MSFCVYDYVCLLLLRRPPRSPRTVSRFPDTSLVRSEPAGMPSVAALDQLKAEIRGKKVVCSISGGNNDLARYPEVIERSLIYEGLKHYFIIEFAQKPEIGRAHV